MAQSNTKNRKVLKTKMSQALSAEISQLSEGMQDMLIDDLITALENRLAILNKVQSNMSCYLDVGVTVTQ